MKKLYFVLRLPVLLHYYYQGVVNSPSRLRIPINLHESSQCNISKSSELGDLLRQVTLLIWDEVPMQHRYSDMPRLGWPPYAHTRAVLAKNKNSLSLFLSSGIHPTGHLITHRACHPTGRVIPYGHVIPPGMSSQKVCHIIGISSSTEHVIPPGMSSPTGNVITWASHQPPSMSSHRACHTGHVIPHRTCHPTGRVIPPGHLITHRACHPTGHLITHRACNPTGHVIPHRASHPAPNGHVISYRACDHLRISSPTEHVIPPRF